MGSVAGVGDDGGGGDGLPPFNPLAKLLVLHDRSIEAANKLYSILEDALSSIGKSAPRSRSVLLRLWVFDLPSAERE